MHIYIEELTDEINKLKQKLKEEKMKNEKLEKEKTNGTEETINMFVLAKKMQDENQIQYNLRQKIERLENENSNLRKQLYKKDGTNKKVERICKNIGKRIRKYAEEEIEETLKKTIYK